MIRSRSILLFSLLLAPPFSAAATQLADTQPAATQPTLEQLKLQSKAETLAGVVGLPIHKVKAISDVIELSMKDEFLHATASLPAPLEEAVIQAPGLVGITTIRLQGVSAGGEQPLGFSLQNTDFNTPDGIFIQTSILKNPVQLTISQDLARLNDEVHSIQLLQAMRGLDEGNPRVSLYVRDSTAPGNDITLQAESLAELRRANPAAVARYVDPIFRKLNQEGLLAKVDPRLAWQVFAKVYEPDEALRAKLNALLPRLGVDDFSEREAASVQLEKLGQPAALALMSWERERLNEEQISRIDAFTARFKPADEAEVARLRTDPDFLLDCLYIDDPAIRKQSLQALEKLTGKPIEFELDAAPAERLAAIERLRETIGRPLKRGAKASQTEQPQP